MIDLRPCGAPVMVDEAGQQDSGVIGPVMVSGMSCRQSSPHGWWNALGLQEATGPSRSDSSCLDRLVDRLSSGLIRGGLCKTQDRHRQDRHQNKNTAAGSSHCTFALNAPVMPDRAVTHISDHRIMVRHLILFQWMGTDSFCFIWWKFFVDDQAAASGWWDPKDGCLRSLQIAPCHRLPGGPDQCPPRSNTSRAPQCRRCLPET